MAFKIGFLAEYPEIKNTEESLISPEQPVVSRKSVVSVYFEECNKTLAYYNDQFDLQRGNRVYVDGMFEGILGRVTDVNYNFKIKMSEYKHVIAVVDTNVNGKFYMAGSHFVTFDRAVIPACKVVNWYKAPSDNEDEYVSGSDDFSFNLDNLRDFDVSPAVAERGYNYYMENRVGYICIDGTKGYAIVTGSEAYEVEFDFDNGEISNIVCSCFCSYNCKHELAVMLQLKETLELIGKHYKDEYERTGYFAIVNKAKFFNFVIDGSVNGTFTL